MPVNPHVQRPRVFVGCSSEQLPVAKELQVLLDHKCEVEVWDQGLFVVGGSTLASLVKGSRRFDFAVLVVSADDQTERRGDLISTTRDNVVFELGLFMGVLGAERTFMVQNGTAPLALPSDLAGVTSVAYKPHSSGNLRASLGAVATQLESAVEAIGPITADMRVTAAVQEGEQDEAASSTAPKSRPSTDDDSKFVTGCVARWMRNRPEDGRSIQAVVLGLQDLGYVLTPSVPSSARTPSQTYLRVLRPDGKNAGYLESTKFSFVGTAALLRHREAWDGKYPYITWSDEGAVDLVLRVARDWQQS